MTALNATQARNEWSAVLDSVVREKPQFIKRTRDYMFLADISVLEDILTAYTFHAEIFTEDDGSLTASLDEISLVENGTDMQDALHKLGAAILEYANDFYNNYSYWARGDGKQHIPFILKALVINNVEKIGGLIKCRRGEI